MEINTLTVGSSVPLGFDETCKMALPVDIQVIIISNVS